MKFRLSTFFWLFSLTCLAVLLFISNQRYQTLLKKVSEREDRIRSEYFKAAGVPLSDARLMQALEFGDNSSAHCVRQFAKDDAYKKNHADAASK